MVLELSHLANIPPKALTIGWRSLLFDVDQGIQDLPIAPGTRDPDTLHSYLLHPWSGSHEHIVRCNAKDPGCRNVLTHPTKQDQPQSSHYHHQMIILAMTCLAPSHPTSGFLTSAIQLCPAWPQPQSIQLQPPQTWPWQIFSSFSPIFSRLPLSQVIPASPINGSPIQDGIFVLQGWQEKAYSWKENFLLL